MPTLLQQTPADKPLGDVVANWGGRNFLVEFKRARGNVQAERFEKAYKFDRVQTWTESEEGQEDPEVRDSAHWISWGTKESDETADLLFLPYSRTPLRNEVIEDALNLQGFIDALLSQDKEVGAEWNRVEKYLRYLAGSSGGVGDPGGIRGFIINVSDAGKIGVVAYTGITDLDLKYDISPEIDQPDPTPSSPQLGDLKHGQEPNGFNRPLNKRGLGSGCG